MRDTLTETVLVTGGAGYIGSHVVRDLDAAGYNIIVLDNLSTGNADSILAGELVRGDTGDAELIGKLIRQYKIRSVLHFAAFIEVEESVRNPLKYYRNNSMNSLELIRACMEHGVEHFIFSSTAAVYGIPGHVPVTEEAPLSPINPYGRSKLITEQMLADAAASDKRFRYISLRYFNVAGADVEGRIGQNYKNPTHLITRALKTALGRYPELQIFGSDYDTPDGTAVRDYIHVDDLASAHVLALKRLQDERQCHVFNCGYGRGYSVLEVVDAAKRVTGINFPAVFRKRRAGDPPRLVADNTRIRENLNWIPKKNDLDLILSSAWKWERNLEGRGKMEVDNPAES